MYQRIARFPLTAAMVALSLGAAATTAAFAQTPTHIYELNGSLADTLGGPAIDNTGGATLTATGLLFGAGQGPSLSSAIDANDYSIEMYFRIDETVGYRRLVDFKDLNSDTGLYNLDTSLNFYDLATGPAAAFTGNSVAHLIITRDGASDAFSGYVNGVLQFSFTDSTNLAVFNAAGNIAHFFRDDIVVPNEQSAGFVDFIRIYDAPLTQTEVSARFNAVNAAVVPEASTFALALPALGMIGAVLVRRRKTAK